MKFYQKFTWKIGREGKLIGCAAIAVLVSLAITSVFTQLFGSVIQGICLAVFLIIFLILFPVVSTAWMSRSKSAIEIESGG